MTEKPRAIIESLGVYLPEKSVSTKEIINGCSRKIMLPLERLTGIESRRMAGDGEYSFDLAVKSIEECLSYSKYGTDDLDFIICCNISRYDGPDRYSFEPSTASRLRTLFGIEEALAFDVTNACAGTFTGIYVAEALIRTGAVRRGLVVSGEYITHVTRTAQKEMSSALSDPLLACLTLGDAGAAVLIDAVTDETNDAGIHALDLYTLGRHSDLCIAKVTEKPHGGAVMKTDMISLAKVSVTAFLQHAALTVFKLGWAPALIQHVIPHQTSKSTLDAGTGLVKRVAAGRELDINEKLVINVAERGNTATTSHFVALKDAILSGRINSGENILFGILASGVTVGTAVYRLDDLPDRIRASKNDRSEKSEVSSVALKESGKAFKTQDVQPRIGVEAFGFADENAAITSDTLAMLTDAGEKCIETSSRKREEIDLILSTAVYRSEYLSEPAIASMLAGSLKINDDPRTPIEKRSLAFDILNGGLGFLEACCVASSLIRSGTRKAALVATSEIENNASVRPDHLRGIHESGAAVLLAERGDVGFGAFSFRSYPEHSSALTTYCQMQSLKEGDRYIPELVVEINPEIEELYAKCAATAVVKFMSDQRFTNDDIALFMPPQLSPEFIDRFAELIGVEKSRCVDVTRPGGDLFTATLPYSLHDAVNKNSVKHGDIGLIINVAAGLEVGCASYHF